MTFTVCSSEVKSTCTSQFSFHQWKQESDRTCKCLLGKQVTNRVSPRHQQDRMEATPQESDRRQEVATDNPRLPSWSRTMVHSPLTHLLLSETLGCDEGRDRAQGLLGQEAQGPQVQPEDSLPSPGIFSVLLRARACYFPMSAKMRHDCVTGPAHPSLSLTLSLSVSFRPTISLVFQILRLAQLL